MESTDHNLQNPDYSLLATIRSAETEIRRVRCGIYLPKRSTGAVVLSFFPTKRQAAQLAPIFECSIEGTFRNSAGIRTQIEASKVYLHGPFTRRWSSIQWETRLEGNPTNLMVMQFLPKRAWSKNRRTIGILWLTRSIVLVPRKSAERSYTGEVKIHAGKELSFRLRPDLRLTVDTHYRYSRGEAGDDITISELVGVLELPYERQGINKIDDEILRNVDDLLRVVSLAETSQCVLCWLGGRRLSELGEILPKGYLCPTARHILERILKERKEGYLFSPDGRRPLDDGPTIKRAWRRAQLLAGIKQPIAWHDLRHEFASLLIAAGKHVKYIAKQLRHKSAGFSLDRYGHLFEELPISAVEWWDDLLPWDQIGTKPDGNGQKQAGKQVVAQAAKH